MKRIELSNICENRDYGDRTYRTVHAIAYTEKETFEIVGGIKPVREFLTKLPAVNGFITHFYGVDKNNKHRTTEPFAYVVGVPVNVVKVENGNILPGSTLCSLPAKRRSHREPVEVHFEDAAELGRTYDRRLFAVASWEWKANKRVVTVHKTMRKLPKKFIKELKEIKI